MLHYVARRVLVPGHRGLMVLADSCIEAVGNLTLRLPDLRGLKTSTFDPNNIL